MTTDCDLYNSPRAVIDFRVLDLDDAKFLQSLDVLRTPMSPDLSPAVVLAQAESTTMTEEDTEDAENYSSELPPPLRCLSVSTRSSSISDDDGDASDSSSVSSVSLDDEFQDSQTASSEGEQATSKRCIFATYWDKKGGRPKQPLLSSFEEDSSPSRSEPCSEEQLLHAARSEPPSYEDLLKGNEAPVTTCSPPGNDTTNNVGSCAGNAAATRRRLWDNRYVSQYQSEPVLYQAAAPTADSLRKVRSTSLVDRSNARRPQAVTRRPSCLRQCRFSGDSRRTSSSSSLLSTSQQQQQRRRSSETTVVSFSDHVQVKYLKAEPERFASPGWSKYFM